MTIRFSCSVLALAASAMLAACGGGGSSGGTGQLTLQVTDAPVDDATAVVVQFTGVELKPAGGNAVSIDYAAPRTIDLLALQGGDVASLLDGQTVPAGRYDWVRLKVVTSKDSLSPSYLARLVAGVPTNFPLYVPSGSETGLKLVRGFTVPVNGAASFTIDFDLRKSVVDPNGGFAGGYYLKPALRLVDNAQVGSISGTVALSTLCPTSASPLVPNGPSVYVFAGNGVTPDDIDGAGVEPVTTASVKESDPGVYTYTAAFLSPGDYTVAFTCVGATDQPETSEVLPFLGARNVTVSANAKNQQDFNPPL